jgi:hypothetical protein
VMWHFTPGSRLRTPASQKARWRLAAMPNRRRGTTLGVTVHPAREDKQGRS